MTIRRGDSWGTIGEWDPSVPSVRTDADLHHAVASGKNRVHPVAGDLSSTLGIRAGAEVTGPPRHGRFLPMDAYDLEWIDSRGVTHADRCFVHVVHGECWRGTSWWCASGGFVRGREVLPRSHPNDGIVDVLHVSSAMSLRQRIAAIRRTRWGTHVPHPQLEILRGPQVEWSASAPESLYVDGAKVGDAVRVRVTVLSDAWIACVPET